MNPTVLFKDDDILVLNKPAGMIVNNADTSREAYTLQDFLEENFPLKGKGENDFYNRAGIVHRLDKETSGVIVVARNEESFGNLQSQFKQKKVKKVYIALCHGKIVEEGEINVPIGRLPWNRMRFGVFPKGRESYTKFKVISYKKFNDGKYEELLSLVEVHPQTGRTHQIRVHFQYVNHPLFADELYAGRKTKLRDRKFLKRHFLHASKITFFHPATQEPITFEAPLSPDLVELLGKLT